MTSAISAVTSNRLPDSITDLFHLQKDIIRELKAKNEAYMAVGGELSFLKRQNYVLQAQIENICYLMERLYGDKCPDSDHGVIGVA